MLRTHDLENYDFDHEDPWTDILASVAWAIRSSVHSTKDATPRQLVFGRDMIFHDTFRANWQAIHMHKVRDTLKIILGKIPKGPTTSTEMESMFLSQTMM